MLAMKPGQFSAPAMVLLITVAGCSSIGNLVNPAATELQERRVFGGTIGDIARICLAWRGGGFTTGP